MQEELQEMEPQEAQVMDSLKPHKLLEVEEVPIDTSLEEWEEVP